MIYGGLLNLLHREGVKIKKYNATQMKKSLRYGILRTDCGRIADG